MAACFICHALLRKSLRLMCTAAAAEEQLTAVMAKYSKLSSESVSLVDRRAAGLCWPLTFSPTECTHTPPPVAIKTEEESDVDYHSEGPEPANLDMTEQSDSQGDPLSTAQPCNATMETQEGTSPFGQHARESPNAALPSVNMLEQNEPSETLIIQERCEAEDNSGESCLDSEDECPGQPDVTDQKKRRKWNRRNACIFCEKLVTNYTRHLLRHHKDASEVLQYISINDPDLKIRKQKRLEITNALRNRGNFLHNSKAIFEKEGNLILKRGQYLSSSPSSFTTCKKCLGTFKRKYFHKHFKSCGSELLNMDKIPNSCKKRMLENHSISIIPHLSAASQELKDHILSRLRNDEISTLVKTDPLILAFGSRLMKVKKEARSRKAICSKLRDLGNLLLHLKKEDSSIQELSSLFKPQKYTTFINCVKKMCGFNEETGLVATISIPSRLRPCILGCIEVLYTEMIMGHGSQAYKENLKKQLQEFKLLFQLNWEWEKETAMPLDEDIQTITQKIHELEKSYSKQLEKDTTVLNYENLCEVTLAHIIVMDKNRNGDVAEAELCFYLNRKNEETLAKVVELLSQERKEAIDQLDVFLIPGKETRSVPVLLTKQMRRNIDLIVASRKLVGVSDNNPLLFARPLTSRPFDVQKCLNNTKNTSKLINPNILTSTGNRNHIATISQLYAKTNDQSTEHLAGFLGRDVTVHSSNYKLPLQVIQKGVTGSSLSEFEKSKNNETVTSESLLLDLEKDTTTSSQSVELDLEKCLDESSSSGENTDRQLKERREIQEKKLINQKKTCEAINVIDTTLKELCQSQSETFLEEEGTVSMLANDQNKEKAEKYINLEKTETDKEKILKNVKGRFQSKPQKYKQATCPSQNTESCSVEETQIVKTTKINRFKSFKLSNESIDTNEIKRDMKALIDCKPSKKRKAQILSEDSLSRSDESQNVLQTRKRKTTHTFWTEEELKAVRTYFKDNIKTKTNPGKAKCLDVLRKVPELSRRTWMQLNTQVNNIYKKK